MTEDRILTIEQAAEILQVAPNTAREWAKTGIIPARKLGRIWRIGESDLRRFIAEGGQTPEAD